MKFAELLEIYRTALAEAVVRAYPPLYDAEARHSCGFDLRRLLRRPLGAQADAIRATALSLQRHAGTNVVGEMGTGKTLIAAAAAHLAGFRRPLVVCPPHLVRKWQREILQTVPGAGDRRGLVLGAEATLVATTFGMAIVVASGRLEVWHLFAFTLLTALPWSFVQTVRQAIVPNVVPKRDLVNAVALGSVGFNLMKIIGPAVGGVLIAWFGAGGNFFVQSAAFALVVIMVFLMQVPPTPAQARQSSVLVNLQEGLNYVRSERLVVGLVIAVLIPNLLAIPVYQSLMPMFQKDVLSVGPEGLGLLLAAPGLGALLVTLCLASIAYRLHRRGRLLVVGLVLLGASLVLFSQMRSLPLALAALVLVGGCQMLFLSMAQTILQSVVPDNLRGRVMSVYVLDQGAAPAGALLAGTGAHFFGAPATVATSGLMIVLLAVVLVQLAPDISSAGAARRFSDDA